MLPWLNNMKTYPEFPCAALPYVPHGEPMSLLDDIVAFDGTTIEATVRIRPDSLFAGPEGVPNWVGMEYMAQAIGAAAGLRMVAAGDEVQLGFLVSIRRIAFAEDFFPPGAELRVHAQEVIIAANGLATFDCWICAGDAEWARARINVYQPDDAAAYLAQSSSTAATEAA